MVRLTLRIPNAVPIEVDGVIPERLANLSAVEVARLPVWCGNRHEELGEFFEVSTRATTAHLAADLQFVGDTRNVHHIGARMTAGFVYVEGDVGRHAGAGMSGGKLVIDGGAGDWLGAEMAGGEIEVRHSAGQLVGAAYRGSRRGMTGGTIHVRGDAGDEVGLLMRRGLIAVGGRVGEFAGASMIAGTLAASTAGRAAGAGMKRGTILLLVEQPEVGPGFRFSCEYRPAILGLMLAHLRTLGYGPAANSTPRTVQCYRGDVIHGGQGELLVAARVDR
jgi:formylmethanofuran dehydrogenase subunit C